MSTLLTIIFLSLALAAAAFVCVPIVRRSQGRGRFVLAAAALLLVLGVGMGAYIMLGAPQLAFRALKGTDEKDMPSLVARMATKVRQVPNDPIAWTLLARGYMALDDPTDAAAAYERALQTSRPGERGEIYSAYGEALTLASSGVVVPEAEAAFQDALKLKPQDFRARFFIGLAHAARGEDSQAIALWEGLLGDLPPDSQARSVIVDRIAAVKARAGQAPDINAMVERLAARLKQNPGDPQGWQRLVRAYGVLGETEKQAKALADARIALRNDPEALQSVEAEARK